MKAILTILNKQTGIEKAFACVINTHLSGAKVEQVTEEFLRQGGKLPELTTNEEIAIEMR